MRELFAILRFSWQMYKKMALRRGRYKRFGWRDPEYKTIVKLEQHLIDEVAEWNCSQTLENDQSELIDVANSAFMLWDRNRIDNNEY